MVFRAHVKAVSMFGYSPRLATRSDLIIVRVRLELISLQSPIFRGAGEVNADISD